MSIIGIKEDEDKVILNLKCKKMKECPKNGELMSQRQRKTAKWKVKSESCRDFDPQENYFTH